MTKLLPHLVWRKGIDGDTSGDRRWNDLTWRGRSRSRDPILNFITAYVDATLDDWHEAEGEPARPARYTEGKYWRVVYLPYMDNSETPMDDD